MYKNFFKRFLDIIVSLTFILCFWWLYVVIAILVRMKLGSPVLFKQDRPGLNEKIFKMYKFRTMTNKKDKEGNLLPDKQRINKFGEFLRTSSIDELPELFCILIGKMSIVGPRPLAVAYLPYYNDNERHRHDVRPGLTGLAQVNGRNALQWEKRFKYDLEYVNNISFMMDFKIIISTIQKVFKRENIVLSGTGTIEDFHKYRKKQLEKNNK